MAGSLQSHQLPGGLVVSGKERLKERPPTMASRAMPYTGGNVKNSGELGKMFDISVTDSPVGGPQPPRVPSAPSSRQNSGSQPGPVRKSSGPLSNLHPTGLITSGPLNSSGQIATNPHHQQQQQSSKPKLKYGSAVTVLNNDPVRVRFNVPKPVIWAVLIIVAMGLLTGGFISVAVKKPLVIVVIAAVIFPAVVVFVWNCVWGRRGFMSFFKNFPNAVLRGAVDGQLVKVTGVVTCGSIPLDSSYQRIPRCVYVSTELYEYKGFGGKSADSKYRCFSWGSRHAERYVSDFYISDFQSGLRALVKAGYGSKVSPFVKPATVAKVTSQTKDLSPGFLQWLADRSLSSDNRVMCLKEGYIKEGSTVSVMGMVRQHDNVLMIIPPRESIATGCRWWRCLLPTYVEGLVITCEEDQKADAIPV